MEVSEVNNHGDYTNKMEKRILSASARWRVNKDSSVFEATNQNLDGRRGFVQNLPQEVVLSQVPTIGTRKWDPRVGKKGQKVTE